MLDHDWTRYYTPEEGDTVVEVGAWVGDDLIKYSRQVGMRGRVVAVEPNTKMASQLEEVAGSAPYPNITILKCALWKEEGDQWFLSSSTCESKLAAVGYMVRGSIVDRVLVPCLTIDRITHQGFCTDINLLTIDTEGAELEILEGAKETLRKGKIKNVAIAAYHHPGDYEAIEKILTEAGFKWIGKSSKGEATIIYGGIKAPQISRTLPDVDISYNKGLRVVVTNVDKAEVEIRNYEEDHLYATADISSGLAVGLPYHYFIPWEVVVRVGGMEVHRERLDLQGKSVCIFFQSKGLGDTLAWIPYVEKFQQKHHCNTTVVTYWNHLFEKAYPLLTFSQPGELAREGFYCTFDIGCSDEEPHWHKTNWRIIPLQKLAADMLGVDDQEEKPRVVHNQKTILPYRYVAISEFGSGQRKMWNRVGGWQEVIEHIHKMGIRVISVSSEKTSLPCGAQNGAPIVQTVDTILNAEMFIGVGSGLSWLAWALGVPNILISGFSMPYTEMESCHRVFPVGATCTGCYNDITVKYNRNDYNYCPSDRDFDCSTSISPEMVIKEIDLILENRGGK